MTDEGEDLPDEGEGTETSSKTPSRTRGRAHAPAELPAGVPETSRWSARQRIWGMVLVAGGSLLVSFIVLSWRATRERTEGECKGALMAASVHLRRGDMDLAEHSLASIAPECRAENEGTIGDLQRAIDAKKLEVTTKAGLDAKQTAATREREAVASFPSVSAELRKELKQAAAYIARSDFEKAAPLVAPCFTTLAPFKGTSIEGTAELIALVTQCAQLSLKMKPFQDQQQAELAAAGQKVLAEVAQDRRDGVKYTRDDHIAALTIEKLVLARRYAAAHDEKGFALLIQNDNEIVVMKPLLKVNVIDRGGPGQPFVQIHVRGTTTDLWTTADALQDP